MFMVFYCSSCRRPSRRVAFSGKRPYPRQTRSLSRWRCGSSLPPGRVAPAAALSSPPWRAWPPPSARRCRCQSRSHPSSGAPYRGWSLEEKLIKLRLYLQQVQKSYVRALRKSLKVRLSWPLRPKCVPPELTPVSLIKLISSLKPIKIRCTN